MNAIEENERIKALLISRKAPKVTRTMVMTSKSTSFKAMKPPTIISWTGSPQVGCQELPRLAL
jgi:hypothetical protein